MAKNKYFHTGEFARLCNVNKKTLHYYDEEGIFCPDTVAANGYRCYSSRQLYSFQVIRNLREIGLSLQEIKNYLAARSPEHFAGLLRMQLDWLNQEMRRYQRMSRLVKNKIALLEAAKGIDFEHVTEQILEADRLVLSEKVRDMTLLEQEQTLQAHENYCMEHELNIGHAYGSMVAADDFLTGNEDFVSYYFTKTDKKLNSFDRRYRHLRPAGRYAVAYLRGDYTETTEAYEKLRQYFFEKGYVPTGFSYEESIIDDISAMHEEEYITRIAIRVKEEK